MHQAPSITIIRKRRQEFQQGAQEKLDLTDRSLLAETEKKADRWGVSSSVSMWIMGATLDMRVLTQGSVTYSRTYLLMEMESGWTLENMSEKKQTNPVG